MTKKDVRILAFESSCDETSTAVIKNGREIESLIVATQIKSHQRFGGVVPEVASRHHIEVITQITKEALDEANATWEVEGIFPLMCPFINGLTCWVINT